MRPSICSLTVAGLATALLISACGGGGGDSPAPNDPNNPVNPTNPVQTKPSAVIQIKVGDTVLVSGDSVAAGSTISLDASGSTTPNGTLSYSWTINKQPESSNAIIGNAQAAQTSFMPVVAGEYVLTLTVSNGSESATQQLVLTVTSDKPVAAVAESVINVPQGRVQLDGRSSQPPTGGDVSLLTYSWTLVGVPPGSNSTLDATEATQAQPRFEVDVVGRYTLELRVSYDGKTSEPTTLVVNVAPPNQLPTAEIIKITSFDDNNPPVRGQPIILEARGTPGTGGGTLQYRWNVTKWGDAPVTVEGDKTSRLTITPAGTAQFQVSLSVFDGIQRGSASSSTSFDVVNSTTAENTAPVAMFQAGWSDDTGEVEVATCENGSADSSARMRLYTYGSYDADGDALTYKFTLVSEPEQGATITNFDTNDYRMYFVPCKPGNYTVKVRATDPSGAYDEYTRSWTARTGANRQPSAGAGIANGLSVVQTGGTVILSGESSSDPDSNELTYEWTLIDRPDDSTATLQDATTVRPSFLADKPGTYTAQLVVIDRPHGIRSASSNVSVFAKAQNNAPVVRPYLAQVYDREQPLLISEQSKNTGIWGVGPQNLTLWSTFRLFANAYDPDGDSLRYLWTLNATPTGYSGRHNLHIEPTKCMVGGRWLEMAETFEVWQDRQLTATSWADCATDEFLFSPSQTGIYDLQLLVTDGVSNTGPYRFSVQAATRADYPGPLLEDLLTNTTYSNDNGWLIEKDFGNEDKEPEQVFFPYAGTAAPLGTLNVGDLSVAFNGDMVLKSFRLTAGGGNYTITNLQAVDSTGTHAPKFVGLSNNQVINQGQSVDFQVALPLNGAAECEWQRNAPNLTWSFSIAEKPGFTFSYKPDLSRHNSTHCP